MIDSFIHPLVRFLFGYDVIQYASLSAGGGGGSEIEGERDDFISQ